MASPGYLESLLNALTADIKKPMQAFVREAFTQLRFGAPSADPEPAENMGGHLVPFVTADTADGEVAVAHQLARVPRLAFPFLALDTVNATLPPLTITRAADMTYLYVSSPTTGASCWLYVE